MEKKEILTDEDKKILIEIARKTLENLFISDNKWTYEGELSPGLKLETGMFVTLHKNGRLRGCIGYLSGHDPLWEAASELAVSSAMRDNRFLPLKKEEVPEIKIEISVLTPPEKVTSPEEIILGTHGVIVKKGIHSGVFLPQVATETGWDKETFLNELCSQKAGLKEDAWKDKDTELFTFKAIVFEEN